MNRLIIAIELNDQRIGFSIQWTRRSLKATARLKLARLKHRASEIAVNVAMVLIPLPSVVAA